MRGVDIPALNRKPVLDPDLVQYWEAFCFLTRQRIPGFDAPGPIPLTEIMAYCDQNYIEDQAERKWMIHFVRLLDWEFRKEISKRTASPDSKGKVK